MDEKPTPYEALQAAVNRAKSQSAFARLLGVSQTSVWKWLQSGKRLPAEHVLTAERETGVCRHDLRPDIYPRGLSDPAVANASSPATVEDCGPVVCFDRPAFPKRRARA